MPLGMPLARSVAAPPRRRAAVGLALVALALLPGCATLDALAVAETHRLEGAPFYATLAGAGDTSGRAAIALPARIQPALGESLAYAPRLAELAPIVAAVDARLAQRFACCVGSAPALPPGAPTLYVGSAEGELAPPEAEAQRLPHDRLPPRVLHLVRATPAWREAASRLARAQGADRLLVVELGITQVPKGRRGLFAKRVVLGTGHEEPIAFLTAEDRPLEVLQLTGVLLDAQGRALRAGAEGILARDTPFAAQVVGLERALDDATLRAVLRSERRNDLPGAPLKWEVALDRLVEQLVRHPQPVLPR